MIVVEDGADGKFGECESETIYWATQSLESFVFLT